MIMCVKLEHPFQLVPKVQDFYHNKLGMNREFFRLGIVIDMDDLKKALVLFLSHRRFKSKIHNLSPVIFFGECV